MVDRNLQPCRPAFLQQAPARSIGILPRLAAPGTRATHHAVETPPRGRCPIPAIFPVRLPAVRRLVAVAGRPPVLG